MLCPSCVKNPQPDWVHKLALDNEEVGGKDEWFHGSHNEFDHFDDKELGEATNHWNTGLGHHFSSKHDVASNFMGARHVYHCSLNIKNPRHFDSEHDMIYYAIEHAKTAPGVERPPDWDIYKGPGTKGRWLQERPKVVASYKQHLQSQGHDGITYGNEYEGPKGHKCVIAFHEHQIHIDSRHHNADNCEHQESAADQLRKMLSVRKLALDNEDTGHDQWFHASSRIFKQFNDKHLGDTTGHWNTGLGHHFTSQHDVASSFMGGRHLYHCSLDIKNPKHFTSENYMTVEAYEHAEKTLPFDSNPQQDTDHNRFTVDGKEQWLGENHHAVAAYKQHLISQGHDGITYGNEYEGQKGHKCAIAFTPSQIKITERHKPRKVCSGCATNVPHPSDMSDDELYRHLARGHDLGEGSAFHFKAQGTESMNKFHDFKHSNKNNVENHISNPSHPLYHQHAEPLSAQAVRRAALPAWVRKLALDNEETGGTDEWFHGSREDFDEFDDKHLGENTHHWNTGLGHHFSSQHSVAAGMSHGAMHVYHTSLNIKNPKHYDSEHDMTAEAFEHARTAPGLSERPERETPGYPDSPQTKEMWLHRTPAVGESFKKHLMSQGHDGVTYGNEYEGQHGHKCAIAFHAPQIKITSRHYQGEECEHAGSEEYCNLCGDVGHGDSAHDSSDYDNTDDHCDYCSDTDHGSMEHGDYTGEKYCTKCDDYGDHETDEHDPKKHELNPMLQPVVQPHLHTLPKSEWNDHAVEQHNVSEHEVGHLSDEQFHNWHENEHAKNTYGHNTNLFEHFHEPAPARGAEPHHPGQEGLFPKPEPPAAPKSMGVTPAVTPTVADGAPEHQKLCNNPDDASAINHIQHSNCTNAHFQHLQKHHGYLPEDLDDMTHKDYHHEHVHNHILGAGHVASRLSFEAFVKQSWGDNPPTTPGIRIHNLQTHADEWGEKQHTGIVGPGSPDLHRGFGSWDEAHEAHQNGGWISHGTFNTKGEGDTQMSSSHDDVVNGSEFHSLRGSGFVGKISADCSGLAVGFKAHGNSFKMDEDGKSGTLYPDQGLGMGVIGRIPHDRIKRVDVIDHSDPKNPKVGSSFNWKDREQHLPNMKNHPDWDPPNAKDPASQQTWVTHIKGGSDLLHHTPDHGKTLCGHDPDILADKEDEEKHGEDYYNQDNGVEPVKRRASFRDIQNGKLTSEDGKKLEPCARCFPDPAKPWIRRKKRTRHTDPDWVSKQSARMTFDAFLKLAGTWTPPALNDDQTRANESKDYSERGRRQLALAKNPQPGTTIWRGELRHKDDLERPPSVGMHWTVNPDTIGGLIHSRDTWPKDHHMVVWQGKVDHPKTQTIPRSHSSWSGKHRSMDSEAEVRLMPGAKVRLNGRYVNHGTDTYAKSLVPGKPDNEGHAEWEHTPMDHHTSVEHKGHEFIDYSDVGISETGPIVKKYQPCDRCGETDHLTDSHDMFKWLNSCDKCGEQHPTEWHDDQHTARLTFDQFVGAA